MEKVWCVYLLECKDGSFYCGVTNDLDKRMSAHQNGTGSKYVFRKGFSHLIASKECESRSDACKAEYWIKKLPKWEKLKWFEKD
jgi:putative endonuclease